MDKSIGVYAQHFCNQYAAVSSSGSGAYKSYHVEIPDKNKDTFTRSSASQPRPDIYGKPEAGTRDWKSDIAFLRENYKKAVKLEASPQVASDDYEGRARQHFETISNMLNWTYGGDFSEFLEKKGIPKDVTFEFDYNIDTHKAEVTKISDEKYLEDVKSAVSNGGFGLLFTAFGSRIMNGYISSAYYPAIASNLEICYGQDIADLYIDENGALCGANKNLRKAIEASKKGEVFQPDLCREFPAKDIEGIIKRLISDENITPNISHMGYDGESIYTNDGEFKFGKDFDPNLLSEKRYLMRGSISVLYSYDSWLKNEEMYN